MRSGSVPALQRLGDWLRTGDLNAVLGYARQHKRCLSYLTALTYDPDPLLAWRALDCIGRVAEQAIVCGDIEWVRNHLRRCQWLLSDESGGIGWRAPEMMGEIVARSPEALSEFIPLTALLLFEMEDEDALRFKNGHLWAVGRLAQVRPRQAEVGLPWAILALEDPDPQTRGLGVWCLAQFPPESRPPEVQSLLPDLLDDDGMVQLFDGFQVNKRRIKELAALL